MTIDEVLARRGLVISDIIQVSDLGEWLYTDADYMMIWEVTEPKPADVDIIEGLGFRLIGYYPEHDMYLVKRKPAKKDATTIIASIDYRFGFNKQGQPVAEYKNFKLECE